MAGINVVDLFPRGTFGENLGNALGKGIESTGETIAEAISSRRKSKALESDLTAMFESQGKTKEEAQTTARYLAKAPPAVQQAFFKNAQAADIKAQSAIEKTNKPVSDQIRNQAQTVESLGPLFGEMRELIQSGKAHAGPIQGRVFIPNETDQRIDTIAKNFVNGFGFLEHQPGMRATDLQTMNREAAKISRTQSPEVMLKSLDTMEKTFQNSERRVNTRKQLMALNGGAEPKNLESKLDQITNVMKQMRSPLDYRPDTTVNVKGLLFNNRTGDWEYQGRAQ